MMPEYRLPVGEALASGRFGGEHGFTVNSDFGRHVGPYFDEGSSSFTASELFHD
jgi:hypothetical protein